MGDEIMLPIYAEMNSNLEKEAQKTLSEIIGFFIELNTDKEEDFSDFFPEEVYFSRKEKCDLAIKQLSFWSKDSYVRGHIPALNEYALYQILRMAEEIENDNKSMFDESIFFNHLSNEMKNPTDNEGYNYLDIRNIGFYLDNCFEDYDFLSLPMILNIRDTNYSKELVEYLGINLESYVDIVPPDIGEEIRELSYDIKQAVKQKEIIEFDVFLSHSSLDKAEYVSELSNKLEDKGLSVFEDAKVFKIGQSQTEMMNMGILNSRFVVVFLSSNFIESGWSDYEFKSFLNREINEKRMIILPIWHNLTVEEVQNYNPYLVDKFALDTSKYTLDQIVESIDQAIKDSKEED